MLFILAALLAALSWAFYGSTRSNISWLQTEVTHASETELQACSLAVAQAEQRLKARGCANTVSYLDDGSNTNPGAPNDGSCSIFHPNGGGIKPCGTAAICSAASLAALAKGDQCYGIVYVGNTPDDGSRMYVTSTDSADMPWNFGDSSVHTFTPAWSDTSGTSNTDSLVNHVDAGSPYKAAQYCNSLAAYGYDDWYLPALDELNLVWNNGNPLAGVRTDSQYWTSTEGAIDLARVQRFDTGVQDWWGKGAYIPVRCARK